MIHLDRNHHPSPLDTTTQNKDLILPANPISWSALDDDFGQEEYPHVNQKQPSGTKGPSAPSSPASPADGNSASPTRERSSSLSPAPSPPPAQNAATAASTPLSELSPPPDDFEDDPPKQEDADEKSKDALASAPASPPIKHDDHDPKPSQQSSSSLMPVSSPSARPSPPIDSIATPSAAGTQPTSPVPGDPKVVVMLELQEELLKVCMEFQKRRMALAEPQFQAYSSRLQSSLAWSASVVDARGTQIRELPIMDPPPPLDFYSTERIQELYLELPTVFAKDLARRASLSTSSPLKRERSDDGMPPDGMMNKRQNTGDGKSMSMMPPPPIPSPVANASPGAFPTPMTNGTPSQVGDNTLPLGPQNPSMLGDAQLSAAARDRARQAQMAAQMRQQGAGQQGPGNRQMSPPSNPNPGMGGGGGGAGAPNAIAGPSGSGGLNVASLPPNVQQMYGILQNPAHPFLQYMLRNLPGFQQMPVQMQLQKMLQTHAVMQRERQQNSSGGGGGGGGGGFPGQTSPVSPIAQMGGGGGGPSPQNGMFPMSPGMDMRAMNSTPLSGGGGGGMGAMGAGINGMTPQQRQLLLMQQQQRGGGAGGGMNPGMGMNPQQQQMAFQQQQQERMRMDAQRMAAAAGQGGSPPHPGSPMMGNDFPALRSNAGIPGIARIARSPSDGGASGGMGTPRMGPTRVPSGDDFQRMMQQQQQRGGPGFGGPQGFPGQQPAQGWQQNQLQQQQAMQMGAGGGGGGQYGMGGGGGGVRPGSGYGGGAPSPPASGGMGNNQNWGGQTQGYPFAGSPGADMGMQRHMSGTPGPGQMQQNTNPPTDGDFDPFNWA
ncbi:hypothetical protein B0H14DRAFT_3619022 [Mycena olivaceomarginata]|nr:hypothetical protein B0H14DRAFT_3619022 [Mycena olivaceomarginata]